MICYVIFFSGLAWLIRKIVGRKKVTIVLYHDPDPVLFARHMAFLSKNYRFTTLDHLVESIRNGQSEFPPYSLIVTLDDGHSRNFHLLNTFQDLKIKPTIYLCSSIANTNRKFWFRLPGLRSKDIKGISHQRRLDHLATKFDFLPRKEYNETDRHSLNLKELRLMVSNVDFQSHTAFHPVLTTCADDEASAEIVGSRVQLESMLNTPVRHFAYPNGDYSEREIGILKANGFLSARSTDIGWNDHRTNPYRLKITGVNDDSDLIMLRAELSGIPGYLYNLYTSGLSWKSVFGKHVPEIEKA